MRSQIRVLRDGRVSTEGMRARVVASFILFVATIVSAGPALANYASLIIDTTSGRVLHETNADLTRYPASLTKMMTLYLLFEALERGSVTLDETLPISAHAASQPPTKLGLRPGQSISVENAILALVTKSANDIAAAVAEYLGGSKSRFAWSMTEKAHQIGMSRTSFVNASGLPDPDQVTTARDMATLGLALLYDYPNYYHYFSTDRFYYGGAVHANHNRLLGSYSGLDGIKTGYTSASGYNLVASAFRDGRRFIGVVLGARSPVDRGMIMVGLLDQAFDGGEIIEAQEEDPATPAQIQFAGASAQGTEMAEVVATRSAPPRMMVGAPRAQKASTRAPVRVARAQKQRSKHTVLKLASLSSTPMRSPRSATSGSRRNVKQATMSQPGSHKQSAAGRARQAMTVVAMRGKPAVVATPVSRSQLKMFDSSRKPAGTRVVKLSSIGEKSKVRVAEGGRKRSS